MVAIEHRQKPTATTTTTVAVATTTSLTSDSNQQQDEQQQQQQQEQEEQQQPELAGDITLSLQEQPPQQQQQQQQITNTSTALVKMSKNELESAELARKHQEAAAAAIAKSAVSQRGVDLKMTSKSNVDVATQELTKKVLKLDLTGPEPDEFSLKSPKSPISARLPHQTSLTSSVDVEDRKTLREALYQGIFHRHRRTIFAVGSFLRMLRSRNSQYNTIRSSSEGEDTEEIR